MQSTPYAGQRVTLVTRHEKARVLAPVLRAHLALQVETYPHIDTDRLGTFTREVARVGTQLEAARAKARLAVEHGGGPLGLGSEGSFGPGPIALCAWNLELVLFLDTARGIEVVGRAQGPGRHIHGLADDVDTLLTLTEQIGFPDHGVVLRPDGPEAPSVDKGIADRATLVTTFTRMRAASTTGRVFVESDLRAHRHPTRMAMIERAGRDLAERLGTPCPHCATPGFGRTETLRGLPCGSCGTPTEAPRADRFACVICPHTEERARSGVSYGDPAHCPRCNP
jgi:hypothetical protein